MDLMLLRTIDGALRPATAPDVEVIARLSHGKAYGCTLKTLRNGRFHRKVFALLTLMFDQLPRTTGTYHGQVFEQSFERFRKEAIILAGHYSVEVTGSGDIRFEAVSISYANCPQELIEEIYSDLINFALRKLSHYPDAAALDRIVEQLLDFAG